METTMSDEIKIEYDEKLMSSEQLTLFRRLMAILCCIFGLPGNILTIIVCIKALFHRAVHFQQKVFHLYLVEISILDTCLLLYWIIDTLLAYLHENKNIEFLSLIHVSAFACFIFYILNRLFAAVCSWLITCFTLARFINIFHKFNTIKSHIILLVSLVIILSLANCYVLLLLKYDNENSWNSFENIKQANETFSYQHASCRIRSEYANDRVALLINALVGGVLNLALPSTLIFIVNMIMLCYIKRIYSRQTTDGMRRRSETSNVNYRSTILVISIAYTICYLPYTIFHILMIFLDDHDGILHNWSELTYNLRHVSHSVNFYAYIFTSRRFRCEICYLLYSLFRPFIYCKRKLKFRSENRSRIILLDQDRLVPFQHLRLNPL